MAGFEWIRRFFGASKRNDGSSFEAAARAAANIQPSSSSPVDWTALPTHEAWFDRPDALDSIARDRRSGTLTESDAALLVQWVEDGWITLSGVIPESDVDEINAFVDDLFDTSTPNPAIDFLGYTLDPVEGGRAVNHA